MNRADAMLTDVGKRFGHWTARFQRDAARLTARTREELEDMWAEAQALRHREHATLATPRSQDGHPIPAGQRPDQRSTADGSGEPASTDWAETSVRDEAER